MMFIEREIQRLQFTHDTATVLKIELASPSTYADFIAIMNLTVLYRIKRWVFMDNSFFLLANPPPINPDALSFDDVYPMPITVGDEGPTASERFRWWLKTKMLTLSILLKHNYLLISGFVLLILIPWLLKFRYMIRSRRPT
jgi:hypothetical protein